MKREQKGGPGIILQFRQVLGTGQLNKVIQSQSLAFLDILAVAQHQRGFDAIGTRQPGQCQTICAATGNTQLQPRRVSEGHACRWYPR